MWKVFDFAFLKFASFLMNSFERAKVRSYERKYSCTINFINQGFGGIEICGNGHFYLDSTSHLKSGAFIDCTGGVYIGKFFHVGKGLTIFSSSHDYKHARKLPYDECIVLGPVSIGDFVWVGANVTILSGVSIGDGAIIGAGSVVNNDIPKYSIFAGIPARQVGIRNINHYESLKAEHKFYG